MKTSGDKLLHFPRPAREAQARLSQLKQDLSQRNRELATCSRLLKRETIRRQAAVESLLKSKQHSNHLLEQSKHMQGQLRLLSRRVLSAQEEERKRISRELHDVIAQMLAGINVRLAILKTETAVNTKSFIQQISRTQRQVEKSVDVVHRFAQKLRPAMLDDLGLIPAVHSFLKDFAKETGIRVSLAAPAGVEELSHVQRTVLYRVAQEALTNVARHAQASRVDVSFQRLTNAVRMQI